MRASSVVLGLLSAVVACSASAQQRLGPPTEDNPVRHQPTDPGARLGDMPRMIVKFRSTSQAGVAQIQSAAGEAATSAAVTKLAARMGVTVREARALAAGMHVLEIEPRAGESFAQQLARVRADSDVEFAVPDERRFPHAVPNDPLYGGQWYLQNGAYVASNTDPTLNTQPSAIHAQSAWDLGVGSSTLVIAVLDTGVLYDHPDLSGRLLPGYDFITDAAVANDGDGRDADATDAGDWVTSAESTSTGPFNGCDVENSSWHGTRVAGIIGAASNNGVGVAGVTWNPKILPARVLGKCGGFDSDILDAMAWAAGLHVNGVPDNPQANWAKVENLSLGSIEACPASYQAVVAQLTARGVIVVASAGNEAGPVDTPANCPGVVAVAGLRHTGTKVGYSSLGPEVTVGAPGGNCVNVNGGPCLFSINTTTNDGLTTAGNDTYTNSSNFNVGTSFSAPIVSGIVGLMRSVNGAMTPAQLITRLRQGATAYPPAAGVPVCPASDPNSGECSCTTNTCGAGMANAESSLQGALRPLAIISGDTPSSVTPGSTANLSGSTSFVADGRTIGSYLWTIVSGTGTLTSPNTANTQIVTPSSGGVTVRLTVTDDAGRQDTADWVSADSGVSVTISPTSASVQAGGGTQTFNATVTNAADQSVTWQVNGVTFGSALVGTISVFGVYTAPTTVPSPATVTVTAISNQDSTRMASAQVTITTAPAPPPSGGGGGGGGGAALDLLGLLSLVTLARRFAPEWLRARRAS